MTAPECSRGEAGTPGMDTDTPEQRVNLERPARPSDYGSPPVNWSALAAATVAMVAAVLATLAWVGVL